MKKYVSHGEYFILLNRQVRKVNLKKDKEGNVIGFVNIPNYDVIKKYGLKVFKQDSINIEGEHTVWEDKEDYFGIEQPIMEGGILVVNDYVKFTPNFFKEPIGNYVLVYENEELSNMSTATSTLHSIQNAFKGLGIVLMHSLQKESDLTNSEKEFLYFCKSKLGGLNSGDVKKFFLKEHDIRSPYSVVMKLSQQIINILVKRRDFSDVNLGKYYTELNLWNSIYAKFHYSMLLDSIKKILRKIKKKIKTEKKILRTLHILQTTNEAEHSKIESLIKEKKSLSHELKKKKAKFMMREYTSKDFRNDEKSDYTVALTSLKEKVIFSPEKRKKGFPFGYPKDVFKINILDNKVFFYEQDDFIENQRIDIKFDKNYLWILNGDNEFVFAEEDQKPCCNKKRKMIKHADLVCENSEIRKPAKYGGEFYLKSSEDSRYPISCLINNKSSYSIQQKKKPTKKMDWAKGICSCISECFPTQQVQFFCENSIYLQWKSRDCQSFEQMFELSKKSMKVKELKKEIMLICDKTIDSIEEDIVMVDKMDTLAQLQNKSTSKKVLQKLKMKSVYKYNKMHVEDLVVNTISSMKHRKRVPYFESEEKSEGSFSSMKDRIAGNSNGRNNIYERYHQSLYGESLSKNQQKSGIHSLGLQKCYNYIVDFSFFRTCLWSYSENLNLFSFFNSELLPSNCMYVNIEKRIIFFQFHNLDSSEIIYIGRQIQNIDLTEFSNYEGCDSFFEELLKIKPDVNDIILHYVMGLVKQKNEQVHVSLPAIKRKVEGERIKIKKRKKGEKKRRKRKEKKSKEKTTFFVSDDTPIIFEEKEEEVKIIDSKRERKEFVRCEECHTSCSSCIKCQKCGCLLCDSCVIVGHNCK